MNSKVLFVLLAGAGMLGGLYLLREHTTANSAAPSVVSIAPADAARKPRLPAPRTAERSTADAEPVPQVSRIQKLLKGEELPEIKVADLEGYLAANHRNATSLLAAFRLTSDRELLKEAAEKFPDDPRVAYESWFRTQDKAERQKWFEKWEQATPDNALASYLAAANFFKLGDNDAALQKLEAAASKPDFSYFSRQSVQDAEEAYKAAGYSEAEAKMVAAFGLLLPHLTELKGMSQNLAELSTAYRQAGDPDSANAVVELGTQLAHRISAGPSFMIEDLVAIASESAVLKSLDPTSPSAVPGKTVQEELDALAAQRAALKQAGKEYEAVLGQASAEDLVGYCDRLKLFGEQQASSWLVEKYRTP